MKIVSGNMYQFPTIVQTYFQKRYNKYFLTNGVSMLTISYEYAI